MNKKTSSKQAPLASKYLDAEVLLQSLFQKEVEGLATKLQLDHQELKMWLNLDTQAPTQIKIALLRTAIQYNLEPLKDEILINQYEEGCWQTIISIDGCVKILNAQASFCGLSFLYSNELIDGIPAWIECTIHRTDRKTPITVREYLLETKRDQQAWNEMPRRMLRHRVLQQCIRLAFGVPPTHQYNNKNSLTYEASQTPKLLKNEKKAIANKNLGSRVNFLKANLSMREKKLTPVLWIWGANTKHFYNPLYSLAFENFKPPFHR